MYQNQNQNQNNPPINPWKIAGIAFGLVFIFGFSCIGCPQYKVYEQRLEGEAELQKAIANRKIKTLEAEQTKESAALLADAEVLRAEGASKANKILGDSLKNNEGYLKYLWIQNMNTNSKEVIYVPTEANLPILEAGKR